ncbi:conserved protein of unknown function [Bradyrhizobium sp. ORS 285]|nr:conserved hypothetical protein [Bradyrhizobium sp. ORS 285]SMX60311.1 conserved protein of unknown function [Bradyrhizobium sp. ORS 285]
MPVAPAVRVQQDKHAAEPQVRTGASGLPCAMVYGLYAISPAPGSLAAVIDPMRHTGRLDTSFGVSEPRDFAVRKAPLVRASTSDAPTSTALPIQRLVTTRTPLIRTGTEAG